jgi:hypothetical protein
VSVPIAVGRVGLGSASAGLGGDRIGPSGSRSCRLSVLLAQFVAQVVGRLQSPGDGFDGPCRPGRPGAKSALPRRGIRGLTPRAPEALAQSYAVLDRAGRVQLPHEYTEALGLRERVLLALEADHIGIWPQHAAKDSGGDSENADGRERA